MPDFLGFMQPYFVNSIFSNDQIITSGFGTVLLSPFFVKKPRRSAAMPTFFASTVLKISSSKSKTYFLLVT